MSAFIARMKDEAEARLREIEEEVAVHQESMASLHRRLDVLEDERRRIKQGMAPFLSWKPTMQHPADPAPTNGRQSGHRPYTRLPDETYVDWVLKQTGEFGPAEMSRALGVSRGTAKNKLNIIAQSNIIRSTGQKWVLAA